MKLISGFNPTLESTINLCQPLADWFERNQKTMGYFGLVCKDCLHFENAWTVSNDLKVLGRMANAGFSWLEAKNISPMEKAINAAVSIAALYEREQEGLSAHAKVQYYLNVEGLQKNKSQEKGRRLHNKHMKF